MTLFLAVLLQIVLLRYVPFGDTASDTDAACCHPAASNTHCYQVTLMSNMSGRCRVTLSISGYLRAYTTTYVEVRAQVEAAALQIVRTH